MADAHVAAPDAPATSGFIRRGTPAFRRVNLALFAIWRVTGHGYPWFLWPLFGWGIGIVAHALSLAFGPGSESERRAIDRELERLHRPRI